MAWILHQLERGDVSYYALVSEVYDNGWSRPVLDEALDQLRAQGTIHQSAAVIRTTGPEEAKLLARMRRPGVTAVTAVAG